MEHYSYSRVSVKLGNKRSKSRLIIFSFEKKTKKSWRFGTVFSFDSIFDANRSKSQSTKWFHITCFDERKSTWLLSAHRVKTVISNNCNHWCHMSIRSNNYVLLSMYFPIHDFPPIFSVFLSKSFLFAWFINIFRKGTTIVPINSINNTACFPIIDTRIKYHFQFQITHIQSSFFDPRAQSLTYHKWRDRNEQKDLFLSETCKANEQKKNHDHNLLFIYLSLLLCVQRIHSHSKSLAIAIAKWNPHNELIYLYAYAVRSHSFYRQLDFMTSRV